MLWIQIMLFALIALCLGLVSKLFGRNQPWFYVGIIALSVVALALMSEDLFSPPVMFGVVALSGVLTHTVKHRVKKKSE